MFTDSFLKNRRGACLTPEERRRLDAAIHEVKVYPPRKVVARAGDPLSQSTLLLEGIMSRYLDDRKGLRQLVAIHLPGDFLDLHGYPLQILDHDVATLTSATVAVVSHRELDMIALESGNLTRKLWFATLLDAAIHRAWLFRLGRLDAVGRVAHFLSETNARLYAAGLSDGRRFALALTQADIAEVCGLTQVHVNRVMRQLREDGLCTFRASMVDISDPVGLASRGQFDPHYLYIDDPNGILPSTRGLKR